MLKKAQSWKSIVITNLHHFDKNSSGWFMFACLQTSIYVLTSLEKLTQIEVCRRSKLPDVSLTSGWRQPDVILTSAWRQVLFIISQPDVRLTSGYYRDRFFFILRPDISLTSGFKMIKKTWRQADVRMTSDWCQPDIRLMSGFLLRLQTSIWVNFWRVY